MSEKSNDKLRVFESDKFSYVSIKRDLEKGALKREDINPCFELKYLIFKVLESRNSIDFTKNDNISTEYELFKILYDECNENNQNNCKPIVKVYIPHNYQYMSKERKEEYARKYKMTLKQFEDKYVNGMVDDDIIENHINDPSSNSLNKNKDMEKIVINASKSIVVDIDDQTPYISDIEDDETNDDLSNSPKIDTNFMALTKEYNK